MLKMDLRPGESIKVGSAIITLEAKSGQLARLSIQADKSVPVSRVDQQQGSSAAKIAAENGMTPPA